MKKVNVWMLFLAAGVLFPMAGAATAASHTVQMTGSLTFSPASLTIAKGDTVIWTNTSASTHTSTSGSSCTANGLWNSGNEVGLGTFYSHTFSNLNAGTYPYFCSLHCAIFNMVGSLTITNPPNAPPSVSITNPATGAVFAAPADVTVGATASDADGSVTNVQFRVGSTVLGNVAVAPYAATTNNLPAGNYTLSAVASDNNGAKATNSVNIIVDTPPSVSLTNPVPGATFQAPASVALKAIAADADGSVTNVQFFSGAALLGNVAIAPYNFTVNNLAAGNYSFTAQAVDNHGIMATSAVVNVFVLTNAILSAPTPLANGWFQITILGVAGQTYATEVSSDLQNWSPLVTNIAPANMFNVTDFTAADVLQRFYRTRQDF